jgi:phosphoribosylanthranilate isomerase
MVGLFVNADAADIANIAASAGVDAIQLSGHEPPAALAALAQLGLPALKTLHLLDGATLDTTLATIDAYLAAAPLPRWPHGERLTIILEPAVAGQFGGTGRTTDWALAAAIAAVRPCGLAGGLTPENVAAAVATVRPWLVDVSSGVETDGAKDPAKIAAFLDATRSVDAETDSTAPTRT